MSILRLKPYFAADFCELGLCESGSARWDSQKRSEAGFSSGRLQRKDKQQEAKGALGLKVAVFDEEPVIPVLYLHVGVLRLLVGRPYLE